MTIGSYIAPDKAMEIFHRPASFVLQKTKAGLFGWALMMVSVLFNVHRKCSPQVVKRYSRWYNKEISLAIYSKVKM